MNQSNLDINVGMDGDIIVMKLTGDLVASTAEQLKAQVSKMTEKNFVYILIEMGKVSFMDSSGLGACMAVHKMMAEKGGMVVFSRPSEPVSKVFRLTRADKKLSVSENASAGVAALIEKARAKK